VLIVLAPVATAVDIVDVAAATTATSVAVNATSIISNTNISTTPTDYAAVIANRLRIWVALSACLFLAEI
jgi:hypothetical protein